MVLGCRLNDDSGSVSQHFGDALHDFGSVVSNSEHGIGAEFAGMRKHRLECIVTRIFTQLGKQTDVSTNQRLQRCTDRSDDRSRSHNDSTYDSEITHNRVPGQVKRR